MMTEYKNRLTSAADLKKLNLQNMQLELQNKRLEQENRALKDMLARLALAKQGADNNVSRVSE